MGTRIEAVATATGRLGSGRGARRLADRAARSCLALAGRTPDEIELLVNAGLYHDRNIGEPAVAALIQEDIGANPGHPPVSGHGTFSFDLYNGACGVLTAVSLLDGFLASGTIELGMVVASDTDPDHRHLRGYRFAPVGGAILLGRSDGPEGFSHFRIDTYPEFADRFHSQVSWDSRAPRSAGLGLGSRRGRNVLTVDEAGDYFLRTLECAERSVKELATAAGVDVADVGLLVAAGPRLEFAPALATRVGISPTRAMPLPERLAGAHSAGQLVVLEAATRSGRLSEAGTVLLVSAGSGITVASAVYRT